jgi:hypothetical protein
MAPDSMKNLGFKEDDAHGQKAAQSSAGDFVDSGDASKK